MELALHLSVIFTAILFVLFTYVIAFGAPYLPTLKPKVAVALDVLGLKKGQTLLELGSGDGRVLKAAAQRGITAIGYELNPLLVLYSKIRLWRYRKVVRVVWGNYWRKSLPPADGVFVFLLQPYMKKLDAKIEKEYPDGIRLVSFAFTIDHKKPAKLVEGMYLYIYK